MGSGEKSAAAPTPDRRKIEQDYLTERYMNNPSAATPEERAAYLRNTLDGLANDGSAEGRYERWAIEFELNLDRMSEAMNQADYNLRAARDHLSFLKKKLRGEGVFTTGRADARKEIRDHKKGDLREAKSAYYETEVAYDIALNPNGNPESGVYTNSRIEKDGQRTPVHLRRPVGSAEIGDEPGQHRSRGSYSATRPGSDKSTLLGENLDSFRKRENGRRVADYFAAKEKAKEAVASRRRIIIQR
jgi:hypothetical protein